MKVLITGSSGLIGSEAVAHFDSRGHRVFGIDNNMRADFFGPGGDTTWNLRRLKESCSRFVHRNLDIRDRSAMDATVAEIHPDFVIHCAAQPSHDLAARRPFDDFDVNAVGTLNLLEAVRRHSAEAVFILMSTNKVYGDAPNELPVEELPTRYDYSRREDYPGVDENLRIDHTLHSLFGASKVAADVLAQEYGRYFGMKTGIFRGGCLTGSHHSAVELHGFLAYVVRVAREHKPYTVIGHKGKQVRDQLHSEDVIRAFELFAENPRAGEVYNLGGERQNSISVLEALDRVGQATGSRIEWTYEDKPRIGDHVVYISNMTKFRTHYPRWSVTRSLDSMIEEMVSRAE